MDYGVMFEKIRKMIEEDPDNVTILEEVIDVDLQMDYFKLSLEAKKDIDVDSVIEQKDDLFSELMPIDDKKTLLSKMASVNDVEVFRNVEKYMKQPDDELHDWAILAYQESRMLIQSSLLDKAPIFISTGLGGKKDKLRYCIVLFNKEKVPFSGLQQSIISGEIDYLVNRSECEIEEIIYTDHYCTLMMMIPLKVSVKDNLLTLVNHCNELGDFINPSFLVTNVKKLTNKDVLDALKKDIQNDKVDGEREDDI